ncbi:MAG: hypothetical protein C0513_04295 [Isosphaera sp.]|nr:hypothetical protein [Isosphaera sp.]
MANGASMTQAISISGVTKTFGAKVAVRDLDLEVPLGRTTAFLGPNGAGKTTTIRMIMSIIFPDRGRIKVLGRASAVESKDRIGYLPEERGVYRKMRVASFLEYMARLKGVPRRGLKGRVGQWLDRVALTSVARKKCQELSKGMQQKVQFVAAVIHEPDLIILDEPFSGLDPVNARLMRQLFHELRGQGRTLIFSTHVMQHAEELCDHVVMINRGRKVLDDSLAGIRERFDPRALEVEGVEGVPSRELAERLRKLPGVGSAEAASGHVRVRWSGAGSRQVMAEIVGAEAVRRVEIARPKLEDIFIDTVIREGGMDHDGADLSRLRASLQDEGGTPEGAEAVEVRRG